MTQLRLERLRRVTSNLDLGAADLIIGQLHHVIEKSARDAPPDVQDIDEAFMRARDRFEGRHTLELAIEGALRFEGGTVNDLYRSQRAR